MPRHMSFALTEAQIRNQTKTVTRRKGWLFLKPGDIVIAVNKSQGLKKGEHPVKLATLRVVSARRERLCDISSDDCRREGFPYFTPPEFTLFYMRHNGGFHDDEVTRIEFEYI